MYETCNLYWYAYQEMIGTDKSKIKEFFIKTWTTVRNIRTPNWSAIYWGLILFGIFLRTSQFLFNRSLWRDEAALALNVTHRSFGELLQPLDYHQGAPVGFLFASRLIISIFGNHDYILRVIPFLAGILALILFYRVTKNFLKGPYLAFALLLFSVNDNLIYYSSEFKQYSTDVLIILFLLFILLSWCANLSTYKAALILAVTGGIAIWFSHPAVFVIAGIGIYYFVLTMIKKSWSTIPKLAIVGMVWLLSLGALYFLSLRDLGQNQVLTRYWSAYFIPFPIKDIRDLTSSTYHLLWRFIRDPGGLTYPRLVLAVLGIGAFQLLRTNLTIFCLLLAPVPFLLLGSALKLYPISGRLMLFAVPFFIIGLSKGLEIPRMINSKPLIVVSLILSAVLMLQPLNKTINHLFSPRTGEELRTVLDFMENRIQPGDSIYVYHGSRHAFNYYAQSKKLDLYPTYYGISSRKDRNKYLGQLDEFQGKGRVWFIFSHIYKGDLGSEEEFISDYLNRIGVKRQSFEAPGATVHLFDFPKKPTNLHLFPLKKDLPLRGKVFSPASSPSSSCFFVSLRG